MKYIIDFDNNLSVEEVDQYLVDNNLTKVKQFGSFGHVFLVESDTEVTADEKILSVVHDHEQGISLLSVDIELVDRGVPTSFNIEDLQNWWKVASINSVDFDNQVHDHVIRGSNSTVYLVDSGITVDHPEFTNSSIVLLHSFNDNFVDNKGHGTALSSLIAGGNCALSNPTLKVVKVFDTTQPTLQSDLVAALDAIYADYVANGKKGSVVNMSWAIPKNDYINSKIQYLINQGMYVVASAGNNGQPIGDVTPASIPEVLTIGSYGQDLIPSNFSDYTGESSISYTAGEVNSGSLDGWAPGESIYSATRLGGYSYIAGTSASAAIASAAFAYNLDIVLKDTGNIQDNIIVSKTLEYYSNLTVSRNNLLDLSDPKYSDSLNKIVTYITQPKIDNGVSIQPKYFKAGTTRSFHVFNPITIRKVSYDTLPENTSINDRGFITLSHPEIEGPLEPIDEMQFSVENRDGSTSVFVVRVTVWNQTYDSMNETVTNNSELLENDPNLSYILQDSGLCAQAGPYACGDFQCQFFSGGAAACGAVAKYYCVCS